MCWFTNKLKKCTVINLIWKKRSKSPQKRERQGGIFYNLDLNQDLEHHALNVVLKFQQVYHSFLRTIFPNIQFDFFIIQIFVGYLTRPMSVLEECSVQIARGIFMSYQQHYYLNMNNKNFFWFKGWYILVAQQLCV